MPKADSRPRREIFDIEGHSPFVTFSCYRRLSLLGRDRCKRIVLGNLGTLSLRHQVGVVGYCIMPNHVHALLRPVKAGLLSIFMQEWKRLSANAIIDFLQLGTAEDFSPFGDRVKDSGGSMHVWQPKYYPFNVFTPKMALEKLEYMHHNPVKAGLVKDACEWPWSSAAFFLKGRPSPIKLVPMDGPIVFGYAESRPKRVLKR
jgi:putative transposase